MSQAWLAQRERGTLVAMRLIAWITQRIGYGAGRALLHPICLYFIVFSRDARRASRDYLRRVLGRKPAWRDVYRHYHTFASTILDRVLLLSGRIDDFEPAVDGPDVVAQALAGGRGLLLLGSHVGSFELCRAAGADAAGLVVNVVMHEANAGKIAAWMREVAPERAPNVIAPGQPETMLKIRDALARGEIVAMLGDRPIGRSATLPIEFLGATAQFPTGPAARWRSRSTSRSCCSSACTAGRAATICSSSASQAGAGDRAGAPRRAGARVRGAARGAHARRTLQLVQLLRLLGTRMTPGDAALAGIALAVPRASRRSRTR